MAREQYLRGVDPEELKPSEKPQLPMTFGQKVQKFWYRYRVAVIFAVLVLALSITAGILIGRREKVDYTLVMVTKGMLNNNARTEMAANFQKYGEDLDGDGIVNVRVIPLAMSDPGDYVELSTIFSGGTAVFFAMEPEYYEVQIADLETEDTQYFTELNTDSPGLSENGRYWNWKGSVAQQTATAGLPEDLYFGVRAPIGTASGEDNEKASADCVALLERFIANSLIGE